jgi:hypothetical protein
LTLYKYPIVNGIKNTVRFICFSLDRSQFSFEHVISTLSILSDFEIGRDKNKKKR